MKTIIINASPRACGSSAFIACELYEKFKENGAELINLSSINLKSCTACASCKKSGSLCVIKDDMVEIYPKLLDADKIILISPNHMGFLSSLAKLFTDRWYCLKTADRKTKFNEGKKAVFIFTQGSPDRSKSETTSTWAKNFFTGYGFKFLSLTVAGCSSANIDMAKMKIDEIKMNVAIF